MLDYCNEDKKFMIATSKTPRNDAVVRRHCGLKLAIHLHAGLLHMRQKADCRIEDACNDAFVNTSLRAKRGNPSS
jgi:hypothetical protein